ncbi:hypothetical protein WS68_24020 [Burkholderia sp. TSV86]|nr:hypothetical protein WS68_24020 [Burkholderia sp. TSV86]
MISEVMSREKIVVRQGRLKQLSNLIYKSTGLRQAFSSLVQISLGIIYDLPCMLRIRSRVELYRRDLDVPSGLVDIVSDVCCHVFHFVE